MKAPFNTHLATIVAAVVIGLGSGAPLSDTALAGEPSGGIAGRVVDAETRAPLPKANVEIVGTAFRQAADRHGRFRFEAVPVGSYALRLSHVGYEPMVMTDIIVKSDRAATVDAQLSIAPVEAEAITVAPGYFRAVEQDASSAVSFTGEEIRRAPGSAGDVSRILSGLPSIAKVDDTTNGLIVRGGSTMENGFYLDNIEIPNINHFPMQGTTSGPIGLLNVDFVRDVKFHAGGFSPAFGDRLSSVMELTFREGERDRLLGQLDVSFAGAGLVAEGPLAKGKGSWLLSARRSYLDLMTGAIGTAAIPQYSDVQGKVVYDLGARNKLELLAVAGFDRIGWSEEHAREEGQNVYGDYESVANTVGLNWQSMWGRSGYSQTSLSHTYTRYTWDYQETVTGRDLWRNRTPEQALQLRNVNSYRLAGGNRIAFGVEAKQIANGYDTFWAEYTDPFGNPTPALTVGDRIRAQKLAVFSDYTFQPARRVTADLGLRAGYFSYNDHVSLDPRAAVRFDLSDRTSVKGSFGVFSQHLPLVILAQNEANRDLSDPVAYHTTVGLTHLLADDTRLTMEAYDKTYRGFPMDPTQPKVFVLDEYTYRGTFFNHGPLVDRGRARSRGLEVTVQKKLAKSVYGLAGGSVSKARYEGLDGIERDRVHDNRYMLTLEGGYKPNRKWEFSARWIVAGGAPYTPYDIDASTALNRGVVDENEVNRARYPTYQSLNVRVDRRFNFSGTSLVTYLSVWNAYNHDNISGYYWNEVENKLDQTSQWGVLPVFGVEVDF